MLKKILILWLCIIAHSFTWASELKFDYSGAEEFIALLYDLKNKKLSEEELSKKLAGVSWCGPF